MRLTIIMKIKAPGLGRSEMAQPWTLLMEAALMLRAGRKVISNGSNSTGEAGRKENIG